MQWWSPSSLLRAGAGLIGKFFNNYVGKLFNINVAEPERVPMVLQLDRAFGIERLIALPIVFHRYEIDDGLAVELHGDLVGDHLDPERVPRADGIVGHDERVFGVEHVVINGAGAPLLA